MINNNLIGRINLSKGQTFFEIKKFLKEVLPYYFDLELNENEEIILDEYECELEFNLDSDNYHIDIKLLEEFLCLVGIIDINANTILNATNGGNKFIFKLKKGKVQTFIEVASYKEQVITLDLDKKRKKEILDITTNDTIRNKLLVKEI